MDERDTPEQLKARALRYLVRREHSRAELARKLSPHAASRAALEELLDLLLARKQQSDARYAEERVRVLSRKYGAAKIRYELMSKGIAPQLVEAISSAGELERARAILARRYRSPAATPAERARRARFLQGRGFSSDVVARLVLDREDPV
ncbi:MAG TPA: recombination regulator RecX [Burkholderiales bacterium]|jgi:regulatory protein